MIGVERKRAERRRVSEGRKPLGLSLLPHSHSLRYQFLLCFDRLLRASQLLRRFLTNYV